MRGRLIIQTGDQIIETRLRDGTTVLGRDPGCTIPVADPHASSRHCQITQGESQWVLRDLESHNGTYVRGKKTREASLRWGDTIELGDTQIVFITQMGLTE